ncbi:Bug family tripartite tricarboxylate transporter substrate binding protein [Cupriavidus oxalaticus]|jgi:tripartite-type tricarboxylate transporter receptor subunit TctC|uniref:Extra-cytoplasmic solute receptor n=1 Tax=Cupriavidus oxalaticus TaxID=96344 RepID=A0A375GBP9_9BURK|nr:tripartite tricarboxylate transporter substrate binding protein [Cupriavidus oxalaticus]QEZ44592.1 tripartite tricarboxylate transporter substrate binding protein [Cupriavidus oxalaticus]QRQ84041.1 tripartite tricarboxylate transporter substrate binding protein [Cupriavidus oxalaticus]QRQ91870.1 tripartite tricarboxylate transporter substrate binding protein [Cupriavidus oxalaticus]WQD86461.1 tripartite tricarboxylate transporter substrate binding protein [Cupriavidus oxalaticus]SPC17669.1 
MQQSRRNWLAQAGTLAGAAILGTTGQAFAQQPYPSKPIRLIVPYPAGGGTDTVGRLVGQRLAEILGQPVVVENKPGASGMLGNDTVAKAPADGYTLLLAITAMIQSPSLYKRMPYDVAKDFTPVSLIAKSSDLFVVPNRVPASNMREFLALAKSGKLSYGSYGNGTSSHLHGELLRQQAGIDMAHIPYKGAAPLMSDVLGGQVDSAFVDVTSANPYLGSNKFKILGITGSQRYKALPNVPTFAELGLKGFEPNGWFGLFLPAGAPKDVTARLAAETARIVKLPEVSQKLAGMGLQPVGSTPQELAEVVSSDMPKWARIVRDANIQLD